MDSRVKPRGKYIVPGSVLEEAGKCVRDHACVKDENFQLCGIGYCSVDKRSCILLCEDRCIGTCPYHSNLGNRNVCTCPVRQEIFRKYGV